MIEKGTFRKGTLAELPAERTGGQPPPELVERRRMMVAAVEAGTWRTVGRSSTEIIGGVRVLRFLPPDAKRGSVLHLHGGAFRLGCPEMIGPFAAALAARCDVEVICPAYRLAPEHPFPAGLADAYTVLCALRLADSGSLILSGDSAGGGLAASLAAHCATEAVSLSGLVLLSPWLDLTVTSSTYQSNAATDPLFSRAAAREAADLYLQGLSAHHPLASPLFGSVDGFPPTFISIGEGEVLAEDGRRFYEVLRAAGVFARLCVVAGMEHVAVTRGLALPGAAETFEGVAEFVDRRIRPAGSG
jgi:monoterpene epsilon-lactone hydrolase